MTRPRPFWKSPALLILAAILILAVSVFLMTRASSRRAPASVIEQVRSESAAVEQELAKRGEYELQVRVVAATTELVHALEANDHVRAGNLSDEIKRINALLASLKIHPIASQLKVDPHTGRVTW